MSSISSTVEYHTRLSQAARRFGRELAPLTEATNRATAQQAAVAHASARMHRDVAGLLASSVRIESSLCAVAAGLDGIDRTLEAIHKTLRAPREVSAIEQRDHGIRAVGNGWLEEARTDLTASIERYVYDPVAHLYLGEALIGLGDVAGATDAFERAVRYGVPDYPEIAAGAALRGARAAELIGRPERSIELLSDAIGGIGAHRCPMLHLARAIRTGSIDDLRTALSGDPLLALDAVVAEAIGLDAVAEREADERWIPTLDALEARLREADRLVHTSRWPANVSGYSRPPIAPSGVGRLLDALTAVDHAQRAASAHAVALEAIDRSAAADASAAFARKTILDRLQRWPGWVTLVFPGPAFIAWGIAEVLHGDAPASDAYGRVIQYSFLALVAFGLVFVGWFLPRFNAHRRDRMDHPAADDRAAITAAIAELRSATVPAGRELIRPW